LSCQLKNVHAEIYEQNCPHSELLHGIRVSDRARLRRQQRHCHASSDGQLRNDRSAGHFRNDWNSDSRNANDRNANDRNANDRNADGHGRQRDAGSDRGCYCRR
jgi:hypothetical protein